LIYNKPKSDVHKPEGAAYSDFLIAQTNDRRHELLSEGISYPKLWISSLGKSIDEKRGINSDCKEKWNNFF